MRSNACEMGQHEDCGGNGDMQGCTCDCHAEPDAERECKVCGEELDATEDDICDDCEAEESKDEGPPTADDIDCDRYHRGLDRRMS